MLSYYLHFIKKDHYNLTSLCFASFIVIIIEYVAKFKKILLNYTLQ
jgi:hypothetical protein